MASPQNATPDENMEDRASRAGFFALLSEGYTVDIAIGIVLGTGLLNVINALMRDIVVPLMGLLVTLPSLHLVLNGSTLLIGDFMNALLFFVIFVLVVYFLIIIPIRQWRVHERSRTRRRL